VSRPVQHTHCSYCGTAYAPGSGWPRTCAACGEITWRNPLPVAVALVPVIIDADGRTGLVVVRRGIEPGYGQLALPGGFIDVGESWQEALARELREETTIEADPARVRLFDVQSPPTAPTLQIFGLLPPRPADELPPAGPTEEVLDWTVATGPLDLVFSTHTIAVAAYFASGSSA
jgi:8-oxo-dGTP diphosphatase